MKRNPVLLLSSLVIGMLLLSACSGGGDEGSGGSDGGSGEPVKIGVITSLSGAYSVLGGFVQNTAQLMVNQINEEGGINGRPVELVFGDDQTNPTQAVTEFRRLQGSGVDALIGPISSSSCAAIVDEVEAARIPMVTTCATQSQVEPVRDYVFMSTLSTTAQVEQLMNYLKGKGYTKIGVLHDNSEFGEAGAKAIKDAVREAGVTVAAEETYALSGSGGSTTFVPQITALDRAGADALVVWGAGAPLVTITKEYRQLGITTPIIFSAAAATPLYLQPAGDAAEGVIMLSSAGNVVDAVSADNPSKRVVEDLAAAYQQAYNQAPSQFTWDVCGAVRVLTAAIREAGTDKEAVRDYMEGNPIVGCHGTYAYGEDDHAGISADEIWVVSVRGGTMVPEQFGRGR